MFRATVTLKNGAQDSWVVTDVEAHNLVLQMSKPDTDIRAVRLEQV